MGDHTLVITNNADYFWIDYFTYYIADSTSATPQSSPSSPQSPGSAASENSPTSSQTQSTSTKQVESSAALVPTEATPSTSTPIPGIDVPPSPSPRLLPSASESSPQTYEPSPALPVSSTSDASSTLLVVSNLGQPVAQQTTVGAASSHPGTHGFSKAAIGGIAAGSLTLLLVILALGLWRRRKYQSAPPTLSLCKMSSFLDIRQMKLTQIDRFCRRAATLSYKHIILEHFAYSETIQPTSPLSDITHSRSVGDRYIFSVGPYRRR